MYGPANIFGANSSSASRGTSHGIYGGSSGSSSSYNDRRDVEQIGSYRTEYRLDQPPSFMMSSVACWKDYPPLHITSREETVHLTPLELRIEDYVLIRSGKIKARDEERVKDAMKKGCMNEELIRAETHPLPPVSQERRYNDSEIRQMGQTRGMNSSSRDSWRGGSSSNGNIFGGGGGSSSRGTDYRGGSSNMFGGGGSGSSSANIFGGGSSSAGRGTGSSSANIFGGGTSSHNTRSGSGGTGGSANIFGGGSSGGTGGSSSANIFGGGSSSAGRGGSSSSGNIFGGGSSGGGGSGNIFGGGSSGSGQRGANIFGGGSSSGGNIFGGNSGGGNNLFGNNSGGNNLFGGGQGGNNMFANNQQGQQMLQLMQASLMENRQFMKSITDKIVGRQETQKRSEEGLSDKNELYERYPTPYEDNEIDSFFRKSKQSEGERIVIMSPYPDREDERESTARNSSIILRNNSSRMTNNQQPHQMNASQVEPSNGSRIIGRGANVMGQNSMLGHGHSQSQLIQGQTQSQRPGPQGMRLFNRGNSSENQSSSTAQSRQILQASSLAYQGQCNVIVKLQVQWSDDKNGNMHPHLIEESLAMSRFEPAKGNWQEEVVNKLREKMMVVRSNARLIVLHSYKNESMPSPTFTIEGQLEQQIINISQPYEVNWNFIRDGFAYNFNVRNEHASVTWDQPIRLQDLDFEIGVNFELDSNSIICEIPVLNCRCTVTFNDAPKVIKELVQQQNSTAEASHKLAAELHSTSPHFRLMDLWWNPPNAFSWSMEVERFE